ncbi:MAG: BMP family ABC transporter substrate-binding protein [Synergistaceae bacterium]|jgi:basic membrane protein A|nr:BMP family ABC transporter substrate-binding protein [Synergistaceae bacterium]
MYVWKKFVVMALIAAMGVLCRPAPGSAAEGRNLKIGILTTSGVDDGSFGEDCYNGILEFIKANPGSTVNTVKEPDFDKVLQAAHDIIADYDVLVLPGFEFAPIGVIAPDNPKTAVLLVDSAPSDEEGNPVELDNIYSMTFHEEESGFFAGVAAALQTKTGKVAVVGGMAYPPNVNYHFGFVSGVNYANKHLGAKAACVELPSYAGTDVTGAQIGGNYVGSFADEATGKVIGAALIGQGVDVIFVEAGASGNGTFTAAKEADGVWLIGCDVDQYDDGAKGGSNIMLTSGLKIMGKNITKQLQALKDGTFKGKNEVLGADTDSTGYVSAPGRHSLSGSTLEALKKVYGLVKNGEIVPASNFNGHKPDNFPGL